MTTPVLLSDRRPFPASIQTPIQTKAACTHHWLVASLPIDGHYPSRCRRCSAQRAFPFLDPEADHDDLPAPFDGPALSPSLPHQDATLD